MKTRKTVDVWVTRDSKTGEEPGLLMMHAKKPHLERGGNWTAGCSCMVVPDVKHGRCKRVRLDLE